MGEMEDVFFFFDVFPLPSGSLFGKLQISGGSFFGSSRAWLKRSIMKRPDLLAQLMRKGWEISILSFFSIFFLLPSGEDTPLIVGAPLFDYKHSLIPF